MKMLAFLAGELSNGATYFSTFANVSSNNMSDIDKRFGLHKKADWKPFVYKDRTKEENGNVSKIQKIHCYPTKVMHCNWLGNKIVAWFNENFQKGEKDFKVRFRGKESKCSLVKKSLNNSRKSKNKT
ncbi:uncharacterized protein [Clytia hemisphaerica]|uniref:uncharacterized protein n=1 Tax=Clytia hemisphaerica TaxID=252671 RepID=UPI0034D61335